MSIYSQLVSRFCAGNNDLQSAMNWIGKMTVADALKELSDERREDVMLAFSTHFRDALSRNRRDPAVLARQVVSEDRHACQCGGNCRGVGREQ